METQTALALLRQLANGTDPQSGKAFHADSPYQHPDTVRALFLALRALEGGSPAPTPTPAPARKPRADAAATGHAPSKVGQPWTQQEDERLAAAFDAGTAIPELATAHQRSRAGVEARLARLGKITLPEGALRYKPRTPPASTGNTAGEQTTTPPAAQSPAATYEVRH
ncbi:MAG: hypothetical protein ACREUW_06475 [Burkholderiales bacterium]